MSTQPALADRRDFDVINDTPWDIYYIYVRVSETFDWGDDVMDEDVLSPATAVHIHFSGGTACHHDIRIKYKNGIDIVWSDIDLCAVSKFRVWYDFAEKKYQAHWE
jgi:hypothetical protein